MVSCTYAIGKLDFPDFFTKGRKGVFWRIPIYSNTKLALTLFTLKLADELCERGITVNAADPGIVSTDMITMHMWFDPLTDIFFGLLSVHPDRVPIRQSDYCWIRNGLGLQVVCLSAGIRKPCLPNILRMSSRMNCGKGQSRLSNHGWAIRSRKDKNRKHQKSRLF